VRNLSLLLMYKVKGRQAEEKKQRGGEQQVTMSP
jgi:hypothetical protein